jgi:ferredoxin-NADP reductase
VTIKPGYRWRGHDPGQYLRIGLDIEGVRHWRAYSLTSDPLTHDGLIAITVKHVETGRVSPYIVRRGRPGTIVSLGGVEGDFRLPERVPERLLFVSAGSGVTPIISMLRHLARTGDLRDAVLLHSARHADEVIFGAELRELAHVQRGFVLHEQHTAAHGRIGPSDLELLAPDWRHRELYISGPATMLDAFAAHYADAGLSTRLHTERFQPRLGLPAGPAGSGGSIRFLRSGRDAESDGRAAILEAGESVGLELRYGCREGICHTCVGELRAGLVRDLRTGRVHGETGETVRTCIHAPEGPIEIDL